MVRPAGRTHWEVKVLYTADMGKWGGAELGAATSGRTKSEDHTSIKNWQPVLVAAPKET